jgi:hypothetical protein
MEDGAMDSFWVFLEAMAGIVDSGEVVDHLQEDLSQMAERKREKMKEYLRLVSAETSRLAAKVDGEQSRDGAPLQSAEPGRLQQ